MTEATIILGKNEQIIQLEGHATGSQEVCTAVSTIAYTLRAWLANSYSHMDCDAVVEMSPGHTIIKARGDEVAREVFRAAAIGLLQVAAKYKKYLRVEISEDE